MNSGANCGGNCAVFSGINNDLYRLLNRIFFRIFIPIFLDGTFDKSNILAINRCIHKGNKLRGGRRRPECAPGRGNGWGEDFPRMGILPEVIDKEETPGRPRKPRDREEKQDSHGWASYQK